MGAEVTFITGLYYRPDRFPYSLVRYLPQERRRRIELQLEKRRIDGLNPKNVVSLLGPLLEMTLRPMGKLQEWGSAHDWLASQWLLRNIREDDKAVLHVFQGSCQRTLKAASRLHNVVRVMEVTLPPAPGAPDTCAEGDDNVVGLRAEANEADFVLVQSEYSARCVTRLGVEPSRIIRCHLGVDTDYFSPRPGPRRPGIPRFLFLGGASQRKGITDLLQAWTDLKPDAELILAGNRTVGLETLPQTIPNCRILGRVADSEFVALLQDADVLVHPSLAEGGCNVVYEALACGLPCVVSTNATSAVRSGQDGVVFPVGNVEALKLAIGCLARDPDLRSKMSASARRRALSLKWDRYLVNLAEIYRGLWQHSTTRGPEQVQALAALTF